MFTYLGSSVSFTENDSNMLLVKTLTAINKLSIIWKSDLSDKIKRDFFQAAVVSIPLYRLYHINADKAYREKVRRELHKNATSYIEQILEAISHKTATVHPPAFHL